MLVIDTMTSPIGFCTLHFVTSTLAFLAGTVLVYWSQKVTIFGLEGGKGKDGYIHELYGCNIGLEEQVISKELLKTAAQTSWMVYIPQQFVIFVSR